MSSCLSPASSRAINLGSGDHRAPSPWLNVDRYNGPGVNPDLVADALVLPFRDESIDAVYAGHLVEHLSLEDDLPAFLREVRRVLCPGGRACFVGPDFTRASSDPEWHCLLPGIVKGGCRWPGDEHQWLPSGEAALAAVRPIFPTSVEVPIASIDASWPVVDRVGWQFAIEVR